MLTNAHITAVTPPLVRDTRGGASQPSVITIDPPIACACSSPTRAELIAMANVLSGVEAILHVETQSLAGTAAANLASGWQITVAGITGAATKYKILKVTRLEKHDLPAVLKLHLGGINS